MRRYDIGRQTLIDQIQKARPTWLRRAKQRTDEYAAAGEYTGGREFWGEIKGVYIGLQFEKCAYCETKLQGAQLASKVHEVEHFRPKQSVKRWPSPDTKYLKDFVPPCSTGSASEKGYYRLAYHPFNYAIACTRCNSTLKSNCFPVRGRRRVSGADPSRLASEQALLIYPISDLDEDPMSLITFEGVLAVPVHNDGPAHARAVVTIRFFQLNHEDLTTRRAALLASLWLHLENITAQPQGGVAAQARRAIERACDPRGEFSVCMTAFRALFENNRAEARRIGQLANALADR